VRCTFVRVRQCGRLTRHAAIADNSRRVGARAPRRHFPEPVPRAQGERLARWSFFEYPSQKGKA